MEVAQNESVSKSKSPTNQVVRINPSNPKKFGLVYCSLASFTKFEAQRNASLPPLIMFASVFLY